MIKIIVDFHWHIWDPELMTQELKDVMGYTFTKERITDADLDEHVTAMDKAGVDITVVTPVDKSRLWDSKCCSDEMIARIVQRHPKRFIGYTSFEPLDSLGLTNWKGLENYETSITEKGFQGLKLHFLSSMVQPDDKNLYPIWEKCVELDTPILVHINVCPYMFTKYAGVLKLDEVISNFPKIKFVVAHGGYPWEEETCFLMHKSKNIYMDISAWHKRPTMLSWLLVMAKEWGVIDNVLWGSDLASVCIDKGFGGVEPGGERNWIEVSKSFIHVIKNINSSLEKIGWPTLSNDEIDGILGNNARKLLKI